MKCNEGALNYTNKFGFSFHAFPEWNGIFRNFQKDDNLSWCTQIFEKFSPRISVAYYFARIFWLHGSLFKNSTFLRVPETFVRLNQWE